MKIELTGDQLQEAMADYLRQANPSALLSRVAKALDGHAAHIADAPGEASWVQWAAGRMRVHADLERRLEDDFFSSPIENVASICEADARLQPWLAARGV